MLGFKSLENVLGINPLSMSLPLTAPSQSGISKKGSQETEFPTLKKVFKGVEAKIKAANALIPVTCLITDSRRVVPGSVFFAIEGRQTDGNYYIQEAIDRGAAAVVVQTPGQRALPVAQVIVPDVRRCLATVSKTFFGRPDEQMRMVGITGTNGKTTVAFLTQYLLAQALGQNTGLLGTIHYDLGRRTLPAYRTTPESVDIHSMLRQMVNNGCCHGVMEVSSHGIEQDRVRDIDFPVAAFLNLTQDHIDYHKSVEAYFKAKSKLFTGELGPLPKVAVINADDPYGMRLIERIPPAVKLLTFGQSRHAMMRAESVELSAEGTTFQLVVPSKENAKLQVRTSQLGSYNVSNVLASMAIVHALGYDLEPCIQALESFSGVPGRMQRIECGQPFTVLVDYAHTEDALRNALTMLRSITAGRLRVVFGCGGNRDRDKRALMTAVVNEMADAAWATSDNPRKESIDTIFQDMEKGVQAPERIEFVKDRRRAIHLALETAQPDDCVLIAGKGHETFQEYADTVIPFDDRKVVEELLQLRTLKQEEPLC